MVRKMHHRSLNGGSLWVIIIVSMVYTVNHCRTMIQLIIFQFAITVYNANVSTQIAKK